MKTKFFIFFVIFPLFNYAQPIYLKFHEILNNENIIENQVVVFNNNKAINFIKPTYYQDLSKTKPELIKLEVDSSYNMLIDAIDKTNNLCRNFMFIYKYKNSENNKIGLYSNWQTTDKYTKNLHKQNDKTNEFLKLNFPQIDSTKFNDKDKIKQKHAKYQKQKETKKIGEYNCKSMFLTDNNEKYHVWYTTEINYNWIFLNSYNKIPGTVIEVYKADKLILKLATIENLKIDKIPFTYKDLFEILAYWENKKK
ncbi:MAG: hypothetical protein LBV69_09365 [Bacteroidales bacterium]|jgi:hypothetical protein|nr:hypothetical protein [Bacteroidales bacterium]